MAWSWQKTVFTFQSNEKKSTTQVSWAYKDKAYVYYDWMTRDFFAFLAGRDASKTYWTAPGSGSRVYGSGFQYKARQSELRTKEAVDSQQHNYDYTAKQLYRGIYGTDFPS
jgi:catalase